MITFFVGVHRGKPFPFQPEDTTALGTGGDLNFRPSIYGGYFHLGAEYGFGEGDMQVISHIEPIALQFLMCFFFNQDDQVAGRAAPLTGIPIAHKDLYETAGIRTTGGAKIHASHVPAEDCTAVRKLREAGTVLLGKLNTHEYAYGVTTDNPGTWAYQDSSAWLCCEPTWTAGPDGPRKTIGMLNWPPLIWNILAALLTI